MLSKQSLKQINYKQLVNAIVIEKWQKHNMALYNIPTQF